MVHLNLGMTLLRLGELSWRYTPQKRALKSALAHKTASNTFSREQRNFMSSKAVGGHLRLKMLCLDLKS